jgi:hypothetical protein
VVNDPRRVPGKRFDDNAADNRGKDNPAQQEMGARWRVIPAVLSDTERSDRSPVAVLMMAAAPNTTAHTRDPQPGAELLDVTTARFLRRGFALVAVLDRTALVRLPIPEGWRATLAHDTRTLVIEEHRVPIYIGQIHIEIPPNWYRALFAHASVALLVASNVAAGETFMGSVDAARLAGNLVGATIPLTS